MRALQAKATMLSTTNLFKYCEEANIIILFIVHIGQDQGISIGYQNVPNYGYLYYVYDLNRFGNSNSDLENIISKLDKINA
jgi:hypothetical protein